MSNFFNLMNCSPPGSSVYGILQARKLEWIAISFSRGSSQPRDQTWSPALQADSLACELQGKPPYNPSYLAVTIFHRIGHNLATKPPPSYFNMKVKVLATQLCPALVTSWTVACQAPASMGFSRQEYWSGLPFPSPGDLPDPEIEPEPPELQADSLACELPGKPPNNFSCFKMNIFPHSHN